MDWSDSQRDTRAPPSERLSTPGRCLRTDLPGDIHRPLGSVVGSTAGLVGQLVIGGCQVAEPFRRRRVVGMGVRVRVARPAPVGASDVTLARVGPHPQQPVELTASRPRPELRHRVFLSSVF